MAVCRECHYRMSALLRVETSNHTTLCLQKDIKSNRFARRSSAAICYYIGSNFPTEMLMLGLGFKIPEVKFLIVSTAAGKPSR